MPEYGRGGSSPPSDTNRWAGTHTDSPPCDSVSGLSQEFSGFFEKLTAQSAGLRNEEDMGINNPWYTRPEGGSTRRKVDAANAGVWGRVAGLVDTLDSHLDVKARTVGAKGRISADALIGRLGWQPETKLAVDVTPGRLRLRRWYGEPLPSGMGTVSFDGRGRLLLSTSMRADAGIRTGELVLVVADVATQTCTLLSATAVAAVAVAAGSEQVVAA